MRVGVLLVYVIGSSLLVVAEVSGWDKTGAIAGVIAAATGLSLLAVVILGFLHRLCLKWRRSHTFTIKTTGRAFVNVPHEEIITVVVEREFIIYGLDCYLSEIPEGRNYGLHPDVMTCAAELLDRFAFPTRLKRGKILRFKLTVDAKKTWKGYLSVAAADGSSEPRLSCRDFEVIEEGIDG